MATMYTSSISPKGQITLPGEIRKRLRLKAKDKVAIRLEDDRIVVTPTVDSFRAAYRSVPALKKPRTDREMTEIAAEEHAREAAQEGL
jgi:AbrB family looped-hinge helix DNA binding protein